MDGSAVIKRYADAFLEFAETTIGRKAALDELRDARGVLRDNPEFRQFLDNPSFSYAEKCSSLDNTIGKDFLPETVIFLKLLLKKGRINEFDRMVEYARVKYGHGGKVNALLTASYPLDTPVIEKIKNTLEEILEKKLQVYMGLDPDLLGGVRAEIGHYVIDGSLKKRLDDLKRKLMAVRVS